MKMVIEISEEDWKFLKESDGCRWSRTILKGIINGIPLPKDHGRLIDAEKLLDTFWAYCKQGDFGYHQAEDLIKSAHTIIEADK